MRKIIHFFIFISVLTLSVFIEDQVVAEEEPIKIKTDNQTVTIDIKESGDNYKVYKEDQLIYEGASNQIKDQLTDDYQKYKVGVFENNKIKNVIKITVANPQKDQPLTTNTKSLKNLQSYAMERSINNSNIESTASDKSVVLKWPKLPDEDGIYEVYKNDKKIGETTSLTFADDEIIPGKEYKYTIKSQLKLPTSEAQKINEKLIKNKISLSDEEKKEVYGINGELSTFVEIPENTENELSKSEKIFNTEDQTDKYSTNSLPKDNAYSFVYRTFIPYKSVTDPLRGKYLKGDNRSFATDSNKFRTETSENVQFSGPNSAKLWKEIGRSHRCEDADCKKIIESATASSNRIQDSVNILTSSRIQWTVRHAAAVPFNAPYPDIDYQYFADLTKYKVTLSGTHDGAPNHEFYLFNMGGSSRFIHSHSVKSKIDFWKLLGAGMGNFWKVTI